MFVQPQQLENCVRGYLAQTDSKKAVGRVLIGSVYLCCATQKPTLTAVARYLLENDPQKSFPEEDQSLDNVKKVILGINIIMSMLLK